jgi:hypothetical protein
MRVYACVNAPSGVQTTGALTCGAACSYDTNLGESFGGQYSLGASHDARSMRTAMVQVRDPSHSRAVEAAVSTHMLRPCTRIRFKANDTRVC